MLVHLMKSSGGFIWACSGMDGDYFANMIAQGFGSMGMMTSVTQAKNGVMISEPAHGTTPK